MIVVSSPNLDNYDEWEKQAKASRIIMNCPDEMDVKAMCAWIKRGLEPDKQAGYWKKVKERMEKVGPIPRYIFDEKIYINRLGAVNGALLAIKDTDVGEYFTLGGEEKWYSKDPSHKLVKIVRVREKSAFEDFANAPICEYLGVLTLSRLTKVLSPHDIFFLVLGMKKVLEAGFLEKYSLSVFLIENFVTSIAEDLNELPPPSPSEPRPSVLTLNPHGHPTEATAISKLKSVGRQQELKYRVLYIPAVRNFPLVDGFFFMESPRKTLFGLRMTTAGGHHTTASTVSLFNERLATYFKGWKKLSRDMSWEIIYVQHADSTPTKKWHECDVVNPNNETDAEKEIVAFWDGKVHQYQFVLTRDFVSKIREMRTQQSWGKGIGKKVREIIGEQSAFRSGEIYWEVF
ncbi:retrotransposon hot spot (RHS) protein [Trypanosoma cruzi]|nr:retrotransposon hot spot (RHS) protein [Trypanosoma cruzi]